MNAGTDWGWWLSSILLSTECVEVSAEEQLSWLLEAHTTGHRSPPHAPTLHCTQEAHLESLLHYDFASQPMVSFFASFVEKFERSKYLRITNLIPIEYDDVRVVIFILVFIFQFFDFQYLLYMFLFWLQCIHICFVLHFFDLQFSAARHQQNPRRTRANVRNTREKGTRAVLVVLVILTWVLIPASIGRSMLEGFGEAAPESALAMLSNDRLLQASANSQLRKTEWVIAEELCIEVGVLDVVLQSQY